MAAVWEGSEKRVRTDLDDVERGGVALEELLEDLQHVGGDEVDHALHVDAHLVLGPPDVAHGDADLVDPVGAVLAQHALGDVRLQALAQRVEDHEHVVHQLRLGGGAQEGARVERAGREGGGRRGRGVAEDLGAVAAEAHQPGAEEELLAGHAARDRAAQVDALLRQEDLGEALVADAPVEVEEAAGGKPAQVAALAHYGRLDEVVGALQKELGADARAEAGGLVGLGGNALGARRGVGAALVVVLLVPQKQAQDVDDGRRRVLQPAEGGRPRDAVEDVVPALVDGQGGQVEQLAGGAGRDGLGGPDVEGGGRHIVDVEDERGLVQGLVVLCDEVLALGVRAAGAQGADGGLLPAEGQGAALAGDRVHAAAAGAAEVAVAAHAELRAAEVREVLGGVLDPVALLEVGAADPDLQLQVLAAEVHDADEHGAVGLAQAGEPGGAGGRPGEVVGEGLVGAVGLDAARGGLAAPLVPAALHQLLNAVLQALDEEGAVRGLLGADAVGPAEAVAVGGVQQRAVDLEDHGAGAVGAGAAAAGALVELGLGQEVGGEDLLAAHTLQLEAEEEPHAVQHRAIV
ncbi:uncharacterized protein BcabD6B2_06210 [Babesia caballi]|uniref:Uncharacterized protein n=1 Tax=Babesia caballi TaxID=5871 RepID=A0AAV4LMC7_BABCB|nr:hypothetical protein BcabD6B2_06210 [Babesia caballi]